MLGQNGTSPILAQAVWKLKKSKGDENDIRLDVQGVIPTWSARGGPS